MNDWWFKLKRNHLWFLCTCLHCILAEPMGLDVIDLCLWGWEVVQPLWHHLREASSPSPRPVLQAKRLVMKVYWGGRDFEGGYSKAGAKGMSLEHGLQRDTGAGVLFCQKCNVTWDEGTVQKANLTKHSKSFKHLKNTNGVSKSSKSEAAALLKLAPPTSEFYECLTHRLKGSSFRGSDGGPKREAKMTWCISEVLKDRERKKIDQACCIGLSQDVQGSTLSVRSSCCFGSDLQLSRVFTWLTWRNEVWNRSWRSSLRNQEGHSALLHKAPKATRGLGWEEGCLFERTYESVL